MELRKESPYNDPALVMIVKDEARKMVLFLPFPARRAASPPKSPSCLTPLKRRHVAKVTHGAGTSGSIADRPINRWIGCSARLTRR